MVTRKPWRCQPTLCQCHHLRALHPQKHDALPPPAWCGGARCTSMHAVMALGVRGSVHALVVRADEYMLWWCLVRADHSRADQVRCCLRAEGE
eukprot:1160755-Pelagomonas_calceolata.AAC.13